MSPVCVSAEVHTFIAVWVYIYQALLISKLFHALSERAMCLLHIYSAFMWEPGKGNSSEGCGSCRFQCTCMDSAHWPQGDDVCFLLPGNQTAGGSAVEYRVERDSLQSSCTACQHTPSSELKILNYWLNICSGKLAFIETWFTPEITRSPDDRRPALQNRDNRAVYGGSFGTGWIWEHGCTWDGCLKDVTNTPFPSDARLAKLSKVST